MGYLPFWHAIRVWSIVYIRYQAVQSPTTDKRFGSTLSFYNHPSGVREQSADNAPYQKPMQPPCFLTRSGHGSAIRSPSGYGRWNCTNKDEAASGLPRSWGSMIPRFEAGSESTRSTAWKACILTVVPITPRPRRDYPFMGRKKECLRKRTRLTRKPGIQWHPSHVATG